MLCCPRCFTDRTLEPLVEHVAKETGTCPLCGSRNVPLCDPRALSKEFEPLFELYEESTALDAAPLNELINKHWKIFSHPGGGRVVRLIAGELGINQDSGFKLRREPDQSLIEKWNEFAEELKHSNRYFPTTAPDKDFLSFLLGNLGVPLAAGTMVYRARINEEGSQYEPPHLRKPPSGLAGAGRANPHGISYFYTASDADTAVAEVRPQRGEDVTIATFEAISNLTLIDLRDPYRTFTPFGHERDLEEILFKGLPLLKHLGEELTKPVQRSRSQLDYLPSQYLCEFIKMSAFDGIIYGSSLGRGHNYATFNDSDFDYRSCYEVCVERVEIGARPKE